VGKEEVEKEAGAVEMVKGAVGIEGVVRERELRCSSIHYSTLCRLSKHRCCNSLKYHCRRNNM